MGAEMEKDSYIYTKDTKVLQISYAKYIELNRAYEAALEMQKRAKAVLDGLQQFLKKGPDAASVDIEKALDLEAPVAAPNEPAKKKTKPEPEAPAATAEPEPAPEPEKAKEKPKPKGNVKIAPIKKDIVQHFAKMDPDGELFNIFKDYYTFVNESCRGMMRVTMKDGICSLWNYDEWEEFAFIDIFDGKLRLAISPKYEEMLQPLESCEVPRLLARKRKLIGVLVEDFNELVVEVLQQAFNDAGSESK
jgi:hypothetical protein